MPQPQSQRGISAIDRRSQQIADYVSNKNQAKVNAEQIKLQRQSTLTNTTNTYMNNQQQGTNSGYNTARILNNGTANGIQPIPINKPNSATQRSQYNNNTQSSAPNTDRMIGNEWNSNVNQSQQYNDPNMTVRRQSSINNRDSIINQSMSYIPPDTVQPRAPSHPRSATSQNGHAAHRPLSNGPTPHHIPSNNVPPIDTELYNRVHMLEEQVRLLKHQNRLFLSFMQATEQQLNTLNSNNNNINSSHSSQSYSRPSSGRHTARQHVNELNTSTMDNTAEQSRIERTKQAKIAELQRLKSRQATLNDDYASDISSINDSRYNEQSTNTKQFDQRQHQRSQTSNTKQQHNNNNNKQQRPPSASTNYNNSNDRPSAYEPHKYNNNINDTYTSIQPPRHDIRINESNAAFAAAVDDTTDVDNSNLSPCPDCGRTFNSIALQKHINKKLCQQKPRKIFDLTKKRIEAAVLPGENIKQVLATVKKTVNDDSSNKPVKAIPKWKLDHMRFQEALQHGKVVSDAIKSGVDPRNIPILQTQTADDRVPCPHCSRKFNSTVADRHIPHCKNTINKPAAVGAKIRR